LIPEFLFDRHREAHWCGSRNRATALVEEFGPGGFEPWWIEIGNLGNF
jgi:hypothetical protein